jgi:hypothetical protein
MSFKQLIIYFLVSYTSSEAALRLRPTEGRKPYGGGSPVFATKTPV